MLLPKRAFKVLSGGLLAPAAAALDGYVLDVAGKPERIENESRAYREREGDDSVDRCGHRAKKHEQQRDDGWIEDG